MNFEDYQFQFLNWLRGNNTLHGEKDVWRLNSYSMNCNDYLTEHTSDSELIGAYRRDDINEVRGRERAKYFYHMTDSASKFSPLPFVDTEEYTTCVEPPTIQRSKFREVYVQTKYRESSAQTSPFEPDFIPDEKGKYLDLEIYSICRAIQSIEEPGKYEITLIERLKRRRALEKILNSCKSKSDLERYRRIIQIFEWEEWVAREEDIQYYQNLRLQMMRELIDEKNRQMRDVSDQKVLYRIEKIRKQCDDEMLKIQNKYNRNLRKIEYKRKNIPRRYPKTDIILEHTKMDSELYAPQMRYGVHPKRQHFVGYKTKFDMRMEDLENKMTKPINVIECPFAYINMMAKPKEPPKEYTANFLTDKKLKNLYESLKYFRIKLEPKRESQPKCLIEKEIISTDEITPTVFGIEQDVEAEEEYQKCIFLQKLIKGRAIQSIMYAGKEEFKGLIHEIHSTHSLSAIQELFPNQLNEKINPKILAKQKYYEQVRNANTNLKSIMQNFEGSIIGPLFEFLEKELDRLYEQKRVQAIVMLAEKERYKREAKEANKRQYENNLSTETNNPMHPTTSSKSKDNVTKYLENVLLEEINMKTSNDLRRNINDIARDLDQFSDDIIKKSTVNPTEKKLSEEKMITEIVDNFLFSNVHNQLTKQKMHMERKRNIKAIHEHIYAEYRIAQDVLNDILQDIINDIVECHHQSSDEIQEEETLKEFIQTIIKNLYDEAVEDDNDDDAHYSFEHIMEYILDSIFNSEHLSLFIDNKEKKQFVVNVIINELKDKFNYDIESEDK